MISERFIDFFSFGCKGSKEGTPYLNYGRHLIQSFIKQAMPYKRILDIGAGEGSDLVIAKRLNGTADFFAVEQCERKVAKLKSTGAGVYIVDVEREKLPFLDESIDVVIANQVLEHTKEVFWIFHEITRLLPLGGKLILGVPNLASLHNRLLLLVGRQPSPIKTASAHVRGFTKPDIMDFLNSCFPNGYILRAFGGSNFYPFPPIVARPLAYLFPTMAWSIFMLLEKVKHYDQQFLGYPMQHRLETKFWLGETVL